MKLKPKSTVKNPRALVYKRFIGIEQSLTLNTAYRVQYNKNSEQHIEYWLFDAESLSFVLYNGEINAIKNIVYLPHLHSILQYQKYYFQYNYAQNQWEKITNIGDLVPLSATFSNVAKYQTNKYYFAGSFDFMVKGSIEGTTAQYIKGNIIPLNAMNIKYFNDDIKLSTDDLVVVGGHLYSVENPETTLKQMPKPFKIHFATLNSVL